MIIVYLSIALAVVALIYLVLSALQTFKAVKPKMKQMSDTAAGLQEKMEEIKSETDHLKTKAEQFQHDFKEKKQVVQNTITNVKWNSEEMKSLLRWARTIPNPKRIDRAEPSPELQRIEDRIVNLLFKRKKAQSQ